MNTYHAEPTPAKWPFPPRQGRAGKRSHGPAPSRSQPSKGRLFARECQSARKNTGLSRGAMLADICLVAVWGATIPGLLWLGTMGGF